MATSNNNFNVEQLEILVNCAICLNHYTDPRILPCSHTFCYECIQQAVTGQRFVCPLRDGLTINQNEIDALPLNRVVNDMVDFVNSTNRAREQESANLCENCSKEPAVNWCEQCAFGYCVSCTKSVHSIKALQSHTIVPFSNKSMAFCLEHPDEKFRYWCSQCETLVCRDCSLLKHKDHTLLSTKDAAADRKVELDATIQELMEMKQNLIRLSDETQRIILQQVGTIRFEKQAIDEAFNYLQRLLDERRTALANSSDNQQTQTMRILTEQQMKIDEHLKLAAAQEFCARKVSDSSNPIEILQSQSNLLQNHLNLIEQYQKLDEGCTINQYTFKTDSKTQKCFAEMISTYGCIEKKVQIVKRNDIPSISTPIDLSKLNGTSALTGRETNWVRGYKFSLKRPVKLHAIRIKSDYRGPHVGFVVNEADRVVHHTTIHSFDANMKWVTIPINGDLADNYSVFVWASSGNGSYMYKEGDTQFRVINSSCSVKSVAIQCVTKITNGLLLAVIDNRFSIDMIVDIEEK
ncbi:unnamed protein product [Adineta ricciae]|uniref:Uncharacterized protein n=1 Tax=Adineta ricciae TaxID=249248 RepID=A0A814LCU5_ADIRI|nr:unnamed protein product [Adineta ricciae]CAF1115487.1 unnamed protein product [Adineta ricciae]